MTVRENLAFPLERHLRQMTYKEITKEIEEVLDAVGLRQAIDQMAVINPAGMISLQIKVYSLQ